MLIEQKSNSKTIVVLPTKNEAKSIELMIKKIKALNLPVFVVDEHSTDGTIEKANKLNVEVYQRKGSGKGYGVQEAIRIAFEKNFENLVIIDCDATYPTEMIPVLIEELEKNNADMVVGARPMNSIIFVHRLGNLIHTKLINLLFGVHLTDINSGLRVLKTRKFYKLLDAKGFDIEAQMTARALKKGFKIIEIPINYMERLGRSKIIWFDGLLIMLKIIKERFKRN